MKLIKKTGRWMAAAGLMMLMLTGAEAQQKSKDAPAVRAEQVKNAVIDLNDLQEFEGQPEAVKKLLREAVELAGLDLKYRYGSADPAQGGMDCSGTIYFLLGKQGLKQVPRSSEAQYQWVKAKGNLRPVTGDDLEGAEFDALKPGDLLFWTGTYATRGISHVSIYMGRLKKDGKRVMVGSSEGRRFEGLARNGVSVFDFVLPKAGSSSKFVGFGPIPGLPASSAAAAQEQVSAR